MGLAFYRPQASTLPVVTGGSAVPEVRDGPVELPPWLEELRRSEITRAVKADPRTVEPNLLGVPWDRVRNEVVGGGQASFDEPWEHLSADERVLLYAYTNQLGHIEELIQAFKMLFDRSALENPVVIDLGCGPFTGGLALAAVLGCDRPFTYLGIDRSSAMCRLGERLAVAAERVNAIRNITRQWYTDLESVTWPFAPGWRPVIVIVSYLLASPTLNAPVLVAQLEKLLSRIGRGPVTVLYTNSTRDAANWSFPLFRDALVAADFRMIIDDTGRIQVERWDGPRGRELRYALFQRQLKNILELGGD